MKNNSKFVGLALGLVALIAITMAAGVNGVFNSVNSALGYKVAGAAGTSGQALCSDGTLYDTPCTIPTALTSGSNSNGHWIKDSLGHIHQWGHVSGETSGCNAITFPTAFTDATSISFGIADDFASGASTEHSIVKVTNSGCVGPPTTTGMNDWMSTSPTTGLWWTADGY
jgi:hypothetical protein